MAIRLDKSTPRKIDVLPAKVTATFTGRTILQPRAIFRNAKQSVNCLVDVTATDSSICANLSASLGQHGGGIYYVEFWDGCQLCSTVPVEFDDNCTMVDCEIEAATAQSKWPLWKGKKNG